MLLLLIASSCATIAGRDTSCGSRHLLQVATPLLLKPRLGSAVSEYRRSGSCRSFHLFDRSRLSSYPRQPDPTVFASLDGREAVMRVATQRVVRATTPDSRGQDRSACRASRVQERLALRGEVPARRWRSAHVAGIEAGLGAEPNQCVAAPDVLARSTR